MSTYFKITLWEWNPSEIKLPFVRQGVMWPDQIADFTICIVMQHYEMGASSYFLHTCIIQTVTCSPVVILCSCTYFVFITSVIWVVKFPSTGLKFSFDLLGRIKTLVLCRQSPLNLHQFCLTRNSKYGLVWNWSEWHLLVFCIDLIVPGFVVYHVNRHVIHTERKYVMCDRFLNFEIFWKS